MLDILTLVRPQFLYISLFLVIVGSVIKYRTKLYNKLIAIVLVLVAIVLCSLWGYFTSDLSGFLRWVDAILYCGMIQGIFVASIPVLGWDSVYGLWRYGVLRRKEKELER